MMQGNQLTQIINLIKKTGDKAIVLEQDKPAYVVMTLRDYERLLLDRSEVRGLTENELLDKINREVAIWKSEQERIKEIEEDFANIREKEFDWNDDYDFLDDRLGDRFDRGYNRGYDSLEDDEDIDEFDDFEDDFEMEDEDKEPWEEDKEDEFEYRHKEPWGMREDEFEEDRYYVEPVR